jgi:hypothetical protein
VKGIGMVKLESTIGALGVDIESIAMYLVDWDVK